MISTIKENALFENNLTMNICNYLICNTRHEKTARCEFRKLNSSNTITVIKSSRTTAVHDLH